MLPTILTLAALLSGSLHIRAEYRGPQWHIYLFKPLTTSLIILLALSAPPRPPPSTRSPSCWGCSSRWAATSS